MSGAHGLPCNQDKSGYRAGAGSLGWVLDGEAGADLAYDLRCQLAAEDDAFINGLSLDQSGNDAGTVSISSTGGIEHFLRNSWVVLEGKAQRWGLGDRLIKDAAGCRLRHNSVLAWRLSAIK